MLGAGAAGGAPKGESAGGAPKGEAAAGAGAAGWAKGEAKGEATAEGAAGGAPNGLAAAKGEGAAEAVGATPPKEAEAAAERVDMRENILSPGDDRHMFRPGFLADPGPYPQPPNLLQAEWFFLY